MRAHNADEDTRGLWPWTLSSQDTDFATTLANLRAAMGEQRLRDQERTARFWANARDHTETIMPETTRFLDTAAARISEVATRLHISPTARRRAPTGEKVSGEGGANCELLALRTLIGKLQREAERWEREVNRLEAVARRSTQSVNCVASRSQPRLGHLSTCAAARKKAGARVAETISKAEQAIVIARHGANTIFKNSVVDCYIWTRPLAMPILRIVAQGEPIDANTVAAVLAATEQFLDEGRCFHTSWDLRRLPSPPALSLAVRTVNWGVRHMSRLEVFNMRLTILLPGNMAALQNLVLWMLAALKPSCPIYVGVDGAAAAYFEQELAAP